MSFCVVWRKLAKSWKSSSWLLFFELEVLASTSCWSIVAVSDEAAERFLGDLNLEDRHEEEKASDNATSERMKAALAANGSRDAVTLMVEFDFATFDF